jgi:hypothetical protein
VFEILTEVVMKSLIFWDITPCSLVKLTAVFKHVSGLACSSTPKMEGTCSLETLADFQTNAPYYISEARTLHPKISIKKEECAVLNFVMM